MRLGAKRVLAIVDDLIVESRIEAAARAVGCDVTFVRSPGELDQAFGRGVSGAVLVGMASRRLPWEEMVRTAKARGGCYVVAFGPHRDLELRRRAVEAGADRVIANSAFARALPELLTSPAAPIRDDEA